MALIGAHISIAGGVSKSIERGEKLECNAIQIFTQSSRTWAQCIISKDEIDRFRKAFQSSKIVKRIVAHNSYLLNLSTSDEKLRKQSVNHFIHILNQCEALEIESLITHPGSHKGEGVRAGIRATAVSLSEVLSACKGFQTQILIENTAGQGDCIGSRFEELKSIVSECSDPERIGFCFDTQHAFAAGYDLRTKDGYDQTLENWEKNLGLKKIKAFHLNDALTEFHSSKDRHANIGKGFLGIDVFKWLLNDRRFKNIPCCLETDPGENDQKHREDLAILRSLMRQ